MHIKADLKRKVLSASVKLYYIIKNLLKGRLFMLVQKVRCMHASTASKKVSPLD